MLLTVAEILNATKGKLLCGDKKRSFSNICIDSRNITADEIFVAITGKKYDGSKFAQNVVKQGIKGLILNENKINELPLTEWQNKNIVCILVKDATKAIGDIAHFNRNRFNVSVVAITGSNGKTTTRKMISAIVERRFKTLSTSGNFNNEIGVPLTLFKLDGSHQWVVLELGMNARGEIERLAEICMPDIGVITNIGAAHLEKLGSIDEVANAKKELLKKIKPNGTVVLNADDSRLLQIADETAKKTLLFGLSKRSAIRAEAIKKTLNGISFNLILPKESVSINLNAVGNFMVLNALAAASVGYLLGINGANIKAGLEKFKPAHGRMNVIESGGIHIIDDSYNANPDSMITAFTTFKSLKRGQRGAIVVGDMLELGKHAKAMHQKIGFISVTSNIAKLYVTGKFAETVVKGAQDNKNNAVEIFKGTKEKILEDLLNWLLPTDWVLIKGSRGCHMEVIVDGLLKRLK